MADVGIEQLKEDIQADIKANNNQTITGDLLQERLIDTVDTLKGYTDDHVSVSQNTITIGGNYAGEVSTTYDVTLHNSGATFASLEALLSDADLATLIPANVRKGGMTIKFVQTTDNKYIQARCMAQNFTTDVTQWQGVDSEPTLNSKNLVESGGVDRQNKILEQGKGKTNKSITAVLNSYTRIYAYLCSGEKYNLHADGEFTGSFSLIKEDGTSTYIGSLSYAEDVVFTPSYDYVAISIYCISNPDTITLSSKSINEKISNAILNASTFNLSLFRNGASFNNLTSALSSMNQSDVPLEYKKGGIVIKFIESSSSKYISYINRSNSWSLNENDWELLPTITNIIYTTDSTANSWIKEIYFVNKETYQSAIHYIKITKANSAYRITFRGNTVSDNIQDYTMSNEEDGVIILRDYTSLNIIGYIIVNWDAVSGDEFRTITLNDVVFDINKSEEIKEYLSKLKSKTLVNYSSIFKFGQGAVGNVNKKVNGIEDYSIDILNRTFMRKPISEEVPVSINITDDYPQDAVYTGVNLNSFPSELTNLTELSNLGNFNQIALSSTNGYCVTIIKLDILGRYGSTVTGETTAEKIQNIKTKYKTLYLTFTGYSTNGSKIYTKQGVNNGSTLSWIGSDSIYIDSNVATDTTRQISVNSIDSDGCAWMMMHTANNTNTEMRCEAFKGNIDYNGQTGNLVSAAKWSINTIGLRIKNETTGQYIDIQGPNTDNNLAFRSVGEISDIITFRDRHWIKNSYVGCKVLDDTPIFEYVSKKTINTLASPFTYSVLRTPLSNFNQIIADTNISLYLNNRQYEYGVFDYTSCVYIQDEYFYVVIEGDFSNSTTTEITSALNGGTILYHQEHSFTYGISSNPNFKITEGDIINIYSTYESFVSQTNVKYLGAEDEIDGIIDCEDYYISGNDSSNKQKSAVITGEVEDSTVINVVPSIKLHPLFGVGACLTESSAYLLSLMNSEDRKALLYEMFSKERCNMSAVRVSIGTCDARVNTEKYSYDDSATLNVNIPTFSIGTQSPATKDYLYIIPILKEILDINSDVKVIAAPWWYPSVITTGNVLNAYSSDVAEYMTTYLIKYIQEYKKIGIEIYGISFINEPEYLASRWSIEQITDFINNYLGPKLKTLFPKVKLIAFDSNLDKASIYGPMVNSETSKYFDAFGFHSYNKGYGKENVMNVFNDNKGNEIYMTERRCMIGEPATLAFDYMFKEIAGLWSQFTSLITLWNFALDENGCPNGEGNYGRRGVITLPEHASLAYKNPEYYMLEYFAKGADNKTDIVLSTTDTERFIYSFAWVNSKNILKVLVMNSTPFSKWVSCRIKGNVYSFLVNGLGCKCIEYRL